MLCEWLMADGTIIIMWVADEDRQDRHLRTWGPAPTWKFFWFRLKSEKIFLLILTVLIRGIKKLLRIKCGSTQFSVQFKYLVGDYSYYLAMWIRNGHATLLILVLICFNIHVHATNSKIVSCEGFVEPTSDLLTNFNPSKIQVVRF